MGAQDQTLGLREYHRIMSKPQPRAKRQSDEEPSEEYTRFDNLARALFRVDKRDVPKHEPVKRPAKPLR